MAVDNKFGKIDIENIPDDEPVFVIRGKDKAAVDAIRHYAVSAHGIGATHELVASAYLSADAIRIWQEANPDVVKVPD